jgi:hypothetical protein
LQAIRTHIQEEASNFLDSTSSATNLTYGNMNLICRVLSMFDLTRPSELTMRGAQASPFRSTNWSSGRLVLEFVRYDRAAATVGELDLFQVRCRFAAYCDIVHLDAYVNIKFEFHTRLADQSAVQPGYRTYKLPGAGVVKGAAER